MELMVKFYLLLLFFGPENFQTFSVGVNCSFNKKQSSQQSASPSIQS